MPEYLDDPSVLTKDKLKSELLAHNVELPSGNPTKDVYVQLYLKNLTAQNNQHVTATTLDAFSSDEELPPPVVSSRSRSSGRKATRKTDKVRPDELDVTVLTDQGLKDELLKHGVDAGPIVASTRKLYEKKLQKLLDDGPAQPPLPELVLTEIEVNHNGNSESDLYSDKEDEVTVEPEPEPVAEPEPAPVVERPLGSRGKPPVTTRARSSQHTKESGPPDVLLYKWRQQKMTSFLSSRSPTKTLGCTSTLSKDMLVRQVEKIAASEQAPKVEEKDVLKELFSNDINSPTGITATCRRPIRGAADRPVKSSDLWNNENSLFSPKTTKTTSSASSYTESRIINRVNSLPSSTSFSSSTATSSFSSSSSRPLSAAPSAVQTKPAARSMSLWIKLFLLAIVAAFLFLVYQAMETNSINPFGDSDTGVASGSTA
ncbi:thymopoietin a isoform X10 [Acanthopagrus latus]|uniref:thymopoietin a isoform X10 n=1 Tax=Acanthopagrus latus TaxID=8177 RepID=UPI00187CB2AB|nr:thymopoietin a isoform X10 [Acanthopagrus latus]